jgi:adenine/guanine/hypoxanthine permease
MMFKGKSFNLKIELIAAFTTYVTAAYIIFVNPDILSLTGMDKGALVVATCLAAGVASILVGIFTNTPIMMAPGMGLNAFFTYTLVMGHNVSWQTGLGVIFFSGFFFLILTLIGVREKIINAIPKCIRTSISIGIGFFIAFIGFKNMGIIVPNQATFVSFGTLTTSSLIGLATFLFIIFLESKKVKGAIIIGVILATICGIIFCGEPFPEKIFSLPPSIAPIFFKLDIVKAMSLSLMASLFTIMYIDLFDSLGTVIAVSKKAKLEKEDGKIEGIGKILSIDAISTMLGALFGTSTTTAYIESSSGIEAGGRTGITAIGVGVLFLLSMFFVPFITIVPAYAVAPALIVVGINMVSGIKELNLENIDDLVPSFLTMMLIPLTYSINNGIMFGFISYTLIKLMLFKFKELNPILIVITLFSVLNLVIL